MARPNFIGIGPAGAISPPPRHADLATAPCYCGPFKTATACITCLRWHRLLTAMATRTTQREGA